MGLLNCLPQPYAFIHLLPENACRPCTCQMCSAQVVSAPGVGVMNSCFCHTLQCKYISETAAGSAFAKSGAVCGHRTQNQDPSTCMIPTPTQHYKLWEPGLVETVDRPSGSQEDGWPIHLQAIEVASSCISASPSPFVGGSASN